MVIAIILIIYLGLIGLIITCNWKIYVKAGKPGWACIVPVYSLVVLLEIVKKPAIWFLYLMLPIVNIIFLIRINIELAKVFGKGSGFAVGLIFLPFIFMPILAFGDAVYVDNELNTEEFGKPISNPNFETQTN